MANNDTGIDSFYTIEQLNIPTAVVTRQESLSAI